MSITGQELSARTVCKGIKDVIRTFAHSFRITTALTVWVCWDNSSPHTTLHGGNSRNQQATSRGLQTEDIFRLTSSRFPQKELLSYPDSPETYKHLTWHPHTTSMKLYRLYCSLLQSTAVYFILILLESCLQTCMTYNIAVCTVNNSWRWAWELSEKCWVSFQNQNLRN
jgi:hypothetical protein